MFRPSGHLLPKVYAMAVALTFALSPQGIFVGWAAESAPSTQAGLDDLKTLEAELEALQPSVMPAAPKTVRKSLLEMTTLPDILYPYGSFIVDTLIPNESSYFQPGIGLDGKSGMPYDHVRIRLAKGQLGEHGNYTAASKISLTIPYLLNVALRKPVFEKSKMTPEQAKDLLLKTFKTLRRYGAEFQDYENFIAWSNIRPNGSIAPVTGFLPALDNGQMTWAIASVVAGLEGSADPKEKEIYTLAQEFLGAQNYIKFYDFDKKMLHGDVQYDATEKIWKGDKTYYLNDMYEGMLAILWAVLNGHIPEDAWKGVDINTVEYHTEAGEKITVLQGYMGSFHEHWPLLYLPIMKSPLAPLYQNYLYAQADHARKLGLPGFTSTSYDALGNYRQMGVPGIASRPMDRSDIAVVFANAMGMLVSPQIGAQWLKNIYFFRGVLTPYGAVESVGSDGYADIFTADGKGLILLSSSGGMLQETEKYLKSHQVPGTNLTMYEKLMELLAFKYNQMMEKRGQAPLLMPTRPFPSPAKKQITVTTPTIPQAGEYYSITDHFQTGHLHGKNSSSVNLLTLEDDVRPGKDFKFGYDVPAYYPYFDQWAFRGTYMDTTVSVADSKYLSVTLPSDTQPAKFDIEMKSDDITLAYATVDTLRPGILSEDGKWKTYIKRLKPIPEADYKPFNYFSVSLHDPSYLTGEYAKYGRKGNLILRNILLTQGNPLPETVKSDKTGPSASSVKGVDGNIELLEYWRFNHGNLPCVKNEETNTYKFSSGKGWKGGYLPYIPIESYGYLHIKARNLSNTCNCFYLEIKNENREILGKKISLRLPADSKWHVLEIQLPKDHSEFPLNYLGVSDPLGNFEISSVSFSDLPLDKQLHDLIPVNLEESRHCTQACESGRSRRV